VEHLSGVVLAEDADAGQVPVDIARVGHDRAEVVVDTTLGDFGFGERHPEVVVEVLIRGRDPLETPAHPRLVGQELAEGRTGNGDDAHVVPREMRLGSVDVLGLEGTAGAGRVPLRRVHEVVDDELAGAIEKLGEAAGAPRGVEAIILLDLHPRQRATVGRHRVPLAHVCFLLGQQRAAGGDPFFP
jgi:hypothetical protein